ncbi:MULTISPECIES: ABC transporter ATP-binding protein [Carnobacterium]|uniref:ATP-binding cassette domain-containing protein n=1 Tax=Carnobacterium inhibens TaxID=147709 RepID=A0ABR7TE37_9LACT|nr:MULTISPECIES: ABC transporter ATP-binding protein [Carnobacterium]MBC9825787.1 ATP-binding cassette domain-containing protein [Carnobacterium inhibens]MDN5372323.1 osmoprotectant transport system ATP-binding protein [Carnobacterium sp.]
MILFENVSKEYEKGKAVVSELDLEIKDGEFFVLIGPSGSGKTTTLKMINRLIPLTEGFIRINDKPISDYNLQELRWNIGYVLQQIALFPNMTVEENITVVPEMKKWSKAEMQKRVTELLASVGLDPDTYRNRKTAELSGGEQQRVGVVRALAANPDIILMDEPFSALDPISKSNLQQDVAKLQKKLNKTIVFVTHDMQEALALGDRICLMNKGKIEQIGTPDEIRSHPKNDFVRNFLQTGTIALKEDQTIQQVIAAGLFEPLEVTGEIGSYLVPEDTIDALIVALAEKEFAIIKGNEENVIGRITKQQLLTYLAQEISVEQESVVK